MQKKKKKKIKKNVFFGISCISISIGCIKFSLLTREYLPLAVNVLANRLEILFITQRDFFRLNSLHSNQ